MLLQWLVLLFTAQCTVCMHLSSVRHPQTVRVPRHLATMMVSGKDGLPPGIADRLSFQTGGSKVARQEKEALILWNLVRECYPSEEAAVAAVNKNSLILNPSMNSSAASGRISDPLLTATLNARAFRLPWQALKDNGHIRAAGATLRCGRRHGDHH